MLVTGGTEVFSYNLFRALTADGRVRPLFLACVTGLHRSDRGLSRLQGTGSGLADEMLIRVGRFDRLMLSPLDRAPFDAALSDVLLQFQPDVVHFHHFSQVGIDALLLVRRLLPKARIVVTLHDFHAICANDGLMVTTEQRELCHAASPDACSRCFPDIAPSRFAARAFFIQSMLALVDRFLAPSEAIRERFVAWGLPPERIELMANAVSLRELPGRPTGYTVEEPTTFAYFGNLAPHKGIIGLLKAVRRLAEEGVPCRLNIHGGMQFQAGSFAQAFTEALERAGSTVVWQGRYRQEEMASLLAATDWVVVPSTWWENAPLVILEAFAAKCPVICSNVGGMAELVRDGVNGLHARVGDDRDLARVMRRAVVDTGLRQRLSEGLPHVQDMPTAARRHIALYQSLLSACPRMRPAAARGAPRRRRPEINSRSAAAL
jgi:glycosyltransferase involved in cell wall biosynthesis